MSPSEDLFDLIPGDWIIWRGEQIEVGSSTLITAGMVAKVMSLHPSPEFRAKSEELFGRSPSTGAIIQFENGFRFLLRAGMSFEKMPEQ
jgi:hypothetical protein